MTKFQIGDVVRWHAKGSKSFVVCDTYTAKALNHQFNVNAYELIGRHGFKIGDRVNFVPSPWQKHPGRVIGFEEPGMVRARWQVENVGSFNSTLRADQLRHEPWPADPVLAAGLKAIVDFIGGRAVYPGVIVIRNFAGFGGMLYYPALHYPALHYPGVKPQTPYAKWAAGRVSIDPESAFTAGWNAAERKARQVANRDAETLKRIAALIKERS